VRSTLATTLTLMLALALVPTTTAAAAAAVATPDHAAYTVELSTDHGGRNWTGTEAIAFENTGAQPLTDVWIRLWANGPTGCPEPGAVVSNVTGGTAGPLAVRCTALPVTLDAPLAPGGTTTVAFDLEIRLPARNDRFGWSGGTGRLGNALPILAVSDDEGWHLDPYAAFGESFYSLASDWDVTLEVPSGLRTPATGELVDRASLATGRVARTYAADGVRDFAWEAGRFRRVGATDELGVAVRLWYLPRFLSETRARRLVRRSASILDTFSAAFGDYPYAEVDVVITTFDAFGGMEYPQLVMVTPTPLVIAHELAHQWWYGIVGNDEYEDPWIDEGFAQWSMYLPFHAERRWPPDPFVGCRMFPWPDDTVRLSSGIDHFAAHPGDYWVPYYQGACALARLGAHLGGIDPLLAFLRSYAQAHWLGVATNDDVIAAIEQALADAGSPVDPQRFLDRWRISRP
jgi:hypothetical protein